MISGPKYGGGGVHTEHGSLAESRRQNQIFGATEVAGICKAVSERTPGNLLPVFG